SNSYSYTADLPQGMLTFDGVNDFVDISEVKLVDDAVDDYTMSMWFNANTIEDYENLIAYSNFDEASVEPFTGLSFFSNNIRFAKRNDSATELLIIDGPSIQTGTWYHVAITKSGSNYVLYLDGQEVNQATLVSSVSHTRSTVLLGATPAGNSGLEQVTGYFDGSIDEVKLWNDARTASEILADMYEKYPSVDDNLEAYYSFDHTSGDLLLDES
ncbi:MAG: LamG domain-containing protein, partial [Cyclobacteriaceae bacterium]